MERTVLAQDVKEILEQNRKILDINGRLIDFMSESPLLTSDHSMSENSFLDGVKHSPPGEAI